MSPRVHGPRVHWIHRKTRVPGVFVAWCGHRVWEHGLAYRERRPTGIWSAELRPSLITCRKCRRHLPIVVRLKRTGGNVDQTHMQLEPKGYGPGEEE